MTTLDELQRSVERLNRAVERLSGGMGKYGFANVYNDDVQLLLSERAELLATVERMRAALEPFAAEAEDFSVCGDGQPIGIIGIKAASGKSDLNVGHLRRAEEASHYRRSDEGEP